MKNTSNDLELKFVDQKHDGFESWIRFKESDWVRLDGLLEYYLLNGVDLTKGFKGQFGDRVAAKRYGELFYDKFSQATSGGRNFDFQKYLNWRKNNPVDIGKAIQLLNS